MEYYFVWKFIEGKRGISLYYLKVIKVTNGVEWIKIYEVVYSPLYSKSPNWSYENSKDWVVWCGLGSFVNIPPYFLNNGLRSFYHSTPLSVIPLHPSKYILFFSSICFKPYSYNVLIIMKLVAKIWFFMFLLLCKIELFWLVECTIFCYSFGFLSIRMTTRQPN